MHTVNVKYRTNMAIFTGIPYHFSSKGSLDCIACVRRATASFLDFRRISTREKFLHSSEEVAVIEQVKVPLSIASLNISLCVSFQI